MSIQSVSSSPEKRPEIDRMTRWIEDRLKELGAETRMVDNGIQTLLSGEQIPLPKILLGSLGNVS